MGNKQTKVHAETVRHPKLGEVIPKERYGKKYVIYSHIIPPGVSLDAWEQEFHKMSNCRKDSLFLPQTYELKSDQINIRICCSTPTVVDLTYQSYMFLLDQEIQSRKKQRRYYTQPDLWYMLYHLLSGANEMEIRDIRIGDVRPKNILLDQNGTIKIISRMSWPGEESGFEKVLRGEGQKCYLAPQQLKSLNNMRQTIDLKTNKTQAFSIGVTVLELALLQSSQDLYNYKDNMFNKGLLETRIQKCSQRYSPFLTKVIRMLTSLNPQERLSSGECWATLSPYGDSIDNVIQFQPDRQKSQRALDNYMKTTKVGKF